MGYFRNVLCFMLFALIIAGCGGGNTTIAANATSSDTTNAGSVAPSGVPGSTSGSVTLQWVPPSTFADGTVAYPSDISGYELFYGPSPTDTPNMIKINGGSTAQYKITLPTGSYYFVICAIDTNGNLGLKSIALKKSI